MVTDVPGQKRGKKTVCETVVWPLTFRSKTTGKKWKKPRSERPRYGPCRTGSKTWLPASVIHKTSPYWWTADAGVRIVAFAIAANMMAWNERGQIQDFFLDVGVRRTPTPRKKKKTKFAPFRFAPSYLQRSGRQQFAGACRLSSRESFHRPWMCTLTVKIAAFRIAANTNARNVRVWIQNFFYLDVGVRRSKPKFAPIRSAPSYLWRSGRQQF